MSSNSSRLPLLPVFSRTLSGGPNASRFKSRGILSELIQCLAIALLLLAGAAAYAQDPPPPPKFRPGAYRGTVFVTTSIEGVGESTATLKVKGRTQAESSLRFMGVPQTAQVILDSGDDSPLKLFRLDYDPQFATLRFHEFENVDSDNLVTVSVPVNTFSIKGNSVHAELSYIRTINLTVPVNYTVRIRLTRVGN